MDHHEPESFSMAYPSSWTTRRDNQRKEMQQQQQQQVNHRPYLDQSYSSPLTVAFSPSILESSRLSQSSESYCIQPSNFSSHSYGRSPSPIPGGASSSVIDDYVEVESNELPDDDVLNDDDHACNEDELCRGRQNRFTTRQTKTLVHMWVQHLKQLESKSSLLYWRKILEAVNKEGRPKTPCLAI